MKLKFIKRKEVNAITLLRINKIRSTLKFDLLTNNLKMLVKEDEYITNIFFYHDVLILFYINMFIQLFMIVNIIFYVMVRLKKLDEFIHSPKLSFHRKRNNAIF